MGDKEEEKMEAVSTPNLPNRGRKRKSSLEIDPERENESATKRRTRSSRKSSSNLDAPEKEDLSAKRPRKRQKPSTDTDIMKNQDLVDDAMDLEELSHFSGLEQETESERYSTKASVTSRESSRRITTNAMEDTSQRRRSARVKTPLKLPQKVEEEEEENDDEFDVRSTSSTISTRSATSHRSMYSTLSRPLMPPLATYNPALHGRRSLTAQPNIHRVPSLTTARTVSETTKLLVNQNVQPTLELANESQTEPRVLTPPPNEAPAIVEELHQFHGDHASENEENVLSSRSSGPGTILVAFIIFLVGTLPFLFKDYGSRPGKVDSSIISPIVLAPTLPSSSLEEIISEFEFRSNTTLEQMNQELENMINFLKPQYEELSNKSSNYLTLFLNETNAQQETNITTVNTALLTEEIYTIIGVDGSSLNIEKEIERIIEETEEMEKEILTLLQEEKKNIDEIESSSSSKIFPSIPSNTLLTEFSEKIEQIEEELDKTIHLLEEDQKNIDHLQQTLQESVESIENNLKDLNEQLQVNLLSSSETENDLRNDEEKRESLSHNVLEFIDVTKVLADEESVVVVQQGIIEAFDQTQERISALNEEYDLMKYSNKKTAAMLDGSNEMDRFLVEQNSLDPAAVLSLADTGAIENFVEEVTAQAIVEAIETAEANADEKPLASNDNSSDSTPEVAPEKLIEEIPVIGDDIHQHQEQFHHDNSFYQEKIEQFGPDLAHSPRGGRIIAPNGRDTSFYYKNRIPVGFVANLLPKNNLSDYYIINEYHRPKHGHCYALSPRRAVVSIKLVKPMLINAIGVTFVLPPSTSQANESSFNQLIDERASVKGFQVTAWEKQPSSGFAAKPVGRFEFLFPDSAQRYLDMNESHYYRPGNYEGHFIERKVDQITNYYHVSTLSSLGPLQKFQFEMLSNYGNSDLTCIYRLHIYGPDV